MRIATPVGPDVEVGVAIRTDGLSYKFGPIEAVRGVTLEVPRGQAFGFLGPNGAGKTTTIRLLLGLLTPTTGRALVLGRDSRRQGGAIRERTGALLEFSGLYERLSAEDNLDFYLRAWRWPRSRRRTRITEVLQHLGLWERRRDIVGTWSAGMKQRLARHQSDRQNQGWEYRRRIRWRPRQ